MTGRGFASPADALWRDIRFALRTHARTPVWTAIAILVLALGIAATSVAFSLVNAFFIRPLPIAQADRFVHVYRLSDADEPLPISFAEFEDVRGLTAVFDTVAAEAPAPMVVGGAGSPERAWGEFVSEDYFTALGVAAAHGRVFSQADDSVVLSDGYWKRRYGGDRRVLGRTLTLEGRVYQIAGVAPAGFRGTIVGFASELWVPFRRGSDTSGGASPDAGTGAEHTYFVLARLGRGATLAQAQAALDGFVERLARERPAASGNARLTALSQSHGRFPTVRDRVFDFSMVSLAVAALVTILACTNLAGLQLVRAIGRRVEVDVRLALGASRARIVGQLLTESVVVSVAAGVLGTSLAWYATTLISGLRLGIARGASASVDVTLDVRVLAVSVAVTLLTSVLCTVTPAIDALKRDALAALRAGPTGDRRPARSRAVPLGVQVMVSMVLLAAGGLLFQSLRNARQAELGFDPAGVVSADIDLRARRLAPADANRFWQTLLADIRALPTTRAAGLTMRPPLDRGITRTGIAPDGFRPDRGQEWPSSEFSLVSPGYFEALRMALVDGRDFTERDTAGASPVVIVNDVLADRFWPGQRAVGRYLANAADERFEIVGVVRRSKYVSIGEPPTAYAYFPLLQGGAPAMTLVASGAGDLSAYQRAIREAVRRRDDTAPVDLSTLSERVRVALAPAAGGAAALALIGLMALGLTALGLFGIVGQTVARRTYEIGVRRALGAPDGHVALLVLRDTLLVVAAGLAGGLAAAGAAARSLTAVLYDVDVTDPLVFAAAPIVLLMVCIVATLVPTGRALRISAARALRHE